MKTHYKILSLLALVAIFLIAPSFTMPGDKGEKLGMYQTYDDYVKGKPTAYYEDCQFDLDSFDATIDGKKVKKAKWDDEDSWGFVDSKGWAWRIFKKSHTFGAAKRITLTGKIWLYTNTTSKFSHNAQGEVTVVDMSTHDQYFGAFIQIAKGKDDVPVDCTESNLKKMFADDPDILAKFKNNGGIHDNRYSKWKDDLINVVACIKEYNNNHK